MTDTEKIATVKALLNNDPNATDSTVSVYLSVAGATILGRLYPFGYDESISYVPREYDYLHCQLAVRYFSRAGADGEKSHTENGVARVYDSADDNDLLRQVVSHAKVV